MLKKITAAVLLGVLAAYLLYPGPNDQPGPVVASGVPERSQSAHHADPNPEATHARDFAAPEPREANDDGTEVVLGLRVRKDRNCKVELKEYVTPTGDMFSAYSCTPHTPPAPGPYAHYNNETLAHMAYGDAGAAAALGHRLIRSDSDKAYDMLIRAAALDGGNTMHLTWLAEQAFGAIVVDDVPQMANLSRQYELAALAVKLGDPPLKYHFLRKQLIQFGAGRSHIESLEQRAGDLLSTIHDIQRTVNGDITTGGLGDA